MDLSREQEIREIFRTCMNGECGVARFDELHDYGMELKKNQKFSRLIEFFNALGNKDRLIIVKTLKQKGEQCVCELEAVLDKSQPSISHHLRTLERIGLIRGWKKGKFTYYELMIDEFNKYLDLFKEDFNIK